MELLRMSEGESQTVTVLSLGDNNCASTTSQTSIFGTLLGTPAASGLRTTDELERFWGDGVRDRFCGDDDEGMLFVVSGDTCGWDGGG